MGTLDKNSAKIPHVAIVGRNNKKNCDIDGDGIPDLDHEELMGTFVKASCPHAHVTHYEAQDRGDGLTAWKKLQKDTQNGQHYDAVLFSIGSPVAIDSVTDAKGVSLTPETLAANRSTLRAASTITGPESFLNQEARQRTLKDDQKLNSIIESVNSKTPVHISAGNHGKNYFNAFNLALGPRKYGATDAQGNITDYSAQNSLITDYKQGTFNVSKVEGGYDINEDSKADIADNDPRLSKGTPLVKRFAGKPVSEAVVTPKEFAMLEDYRRKPHPKERPLAVTHLLNTKLLPDPDPKAAPNTYIYAGTEADYIVSGFKADSAGNIVYKPIDDLPALSPIKNVVGYIEGTSFAGPNQVGKELAQKFPHAARKTAP